MRWFLMVFVTGVMLFDGIHPANVTCKFIFKDFMKWVNKDETNLIRRTIIRKYCGDSKFIAVYCKQVEGYASIRKICEKYARLDRCKRIFDDYLYTNTRSPYERLRCEDFPSAYSHCEQVEGYDLVKEKCENDLKRCTKILNDFKDKIGKGNTRNTKVIQSYCKDFPTEYSQCEQVDGFAFANETCEIYFNNLERCKKKLNDFKDKIGKSNDTKVIQSYCKDFPTEYSQCEQVDGFAFANETCEIYFNNLERCKKKLNDFKDKIGKGNTRNTKVIQSYCKDFPTEYSQCEQVDGFAFANETCEIYFNNLERCKKKLNDFKDKIGKSNDTKVIQSYCKDFPTEYSQCEQVDGFAFANETCEKHANLERCKEIINDFKNKIGKGNDKEVIQSHCKDFPTAYSQCEQVDGFAFANETCEIYFNNLERCKKKLNDFKDKIGKSNDTKVKQSYCKDFPTEYSQCEQVDGFAFANETCEIYFNNLERCKKNLNDFKDKIGKSNDTKVIQSYCKDFPTEYSQCEQVDGFAFANETCEIYFNNLERCKKKLNDFKDKIGKSNDTKVIQSYCKDFPTEYSQCEQVDGFAFANETCEIYFNNLERCKKKLNDFKDKIGKGNTRNTKVIQSYCKDFPTEYSQCEQVDGFAFANETCEIYFNNLERCKKKLNDFKDKIGKSNDTKVIQSYCKDFPTEYSQCEQVDGFAFANETCEKHANLERCKEIINDFKNKIGKGNDKEVIQSHCKDFPTAYSQCEQVDGFAFANETCEIYFNNLERCKKKLNDFKDKIGKSNDTKVKQSYCKDFPTEYSQCEQVDGFAFANETCEIYFNNLERCKKNLNDFKDKIGKSNDTKVIQSYCKDFPTEYSQCEQVDGFAFANETCEIYFNNLERCKKKLNDFKDKIGKSNDTKVIQSYCKDFPTEYSQCEQVDGFAFANETCEKHANLERCKEIINDFKNKIGKGNDKEVIQSHCKDFPTEYSQCEQVDGFAFANETCEIYFNNLERCKKKLNDFKDKIGKSNDTKVIQSYCKDFPTEYSQCEQVDGFAFANETCEMYFNNLERCKKKLNDFKDKIGKSNDTKVIQSYCKDFPTEYSQCEQVDGFAFANETCEKHANLERCKEIINDFKNKIGKGNDKEVIQSHCKDFPTEYSQCEQVDGFAFANETCEIYFNNLERCKKKLNDFKDKIGKSNDTKVIQSYCKDFPTEYSQCEQVDGFAFANETCEIYFNNLERCKKKLNDFKDKIGKSNDTKVIQSYCKDFPTEYSQCEQVDGFAFANETCEKHANLERCKEIINDFKNKIGKGNDTEVIQSYCKDFPTAYLQCEQVDGFAFVKETCEMYFNNLERCKKKLNDFKDKIGKSNDTKVIQSYCKDFPTEYSQCEQVDGFAFANETCEKHANLERCKEIINDFKNKIGKGNDTEVIRSHCEDFSRAYSECEQVDGFAFVKETCEKYFNNLERCKKILNDFKDKIGKGSDTEVILSHCEDFSRAYSQCEQGEGYAIIKKKCEKYENLKRCTKIFNDFEDKIGNGSDTEVIRSHCEDFPRAYLQCKQVEGFAFLKETCEKYANLDEQGWSAVENKGTVCQERNKCPDDVKMLDMMLDPRAKKAGFTVQNVTGVCKHFLKHYHLCKLTPEHRSVKRRCVKILKSGAMSSHPTGFSYIILLCITLLCFVF
ncbi:hypothetical protein O0L34_g18756 [Tuta absoluta]|nr:hypothetical protein O0L34_g18756 [Tuta absoluta]